MSKTTIINCGTYNVLANSMATKQYFQVDDDSFLTLEIRIQKILREITKLMSKQAIIAIQEVDIKLAGVGLHQLFSEYNYYPLTAHYSTLEERDHFGTVIAFPTNIYKLITYGQVKIGNLIQVPENILNCRSPLFDRKIDHDVYTEAKKRDIALLYAKLENKITGLQFVVYNYHMPCAFWWPGVMTLHLNSLLQEIHNISQDYPYILLGDFNIKHGSTLYKYITQGVIDDENYIPSLNWTPYSNNPILLDCRILSNYDVIATTKCKNKKGDLFCETIDYIFCSNHFTANNFQQSVPSDIMPNQNDGSDHLPISCQLNFN